jgi:DNA-directed RNA polymerase subunit omega
VDVDAHDKMQVVLQEIVQDKIYLDLSNQVRITGDLTDPGAGPDFSADGP